MKNKMWTNCPITKKNSEILQSWYTEDTNHTGLDISGDTIYSICYGVVIYVGQAANKTYTVIVQYDREICVSYSNLISVYIESGQMIKQGELLGECEQFVHFEYITTYKDSSIFPVRVGTQTYYKHDPQCIIDGSVLLSGSGLENVKIIGDATKLPIINMSPMMNEEFANSRGGDE